MSTRTICVWGGPLMTIQMVRETILCTRTKHFVTEHIATHTLILLFKTVLYILQYFSDDAFYKSYCITRGQSSFISFATRTACPLLKLKYSILLAMYSWINAFYRVMNDRYSIIPFFSFAVTHDTLCY